MLRLFLTTVAITMVKSSHLSLGDYEGIHNAQPKLISQSVGLHEVPTKVIRITKTIAVKVPVPYPVKVPQHIPIPVPVNRPVPIPVPQIVKVPHHVPIEVSKPVPVELHQQVPLIVSRPIPIPHPIRVPHPVNIERPVFYPVPHVISHQNYGHEHGPPEHGVSPYGSEHEENDAHESRAYAYYTINSAQDQAHLDSDRSQSDQNDFQASQPDYTPHHH